MQKVYTSIVHLQRDLLYSQRHSKYVPYEPYKYMYLCVCIYIYINMHSILYICWNLCEYIKNTLLIYLPVFSHEFVACETGREEKREVLMHGQYSSKLFVRNPTQLLGLMSSLKSIVLVSMPSEQFTWALWPEAYYLNLLSKMMTIIPTGKLKYRIMSCCVTSLR